LLRSGLAWTFALADSSRVILDQNGAEELTPPGQAILVRGVETLKVMSPFLPDEERAQRLVKLRGNEIELTELEQKALEAVRQLEATGQQVTPHTVHNLVGGKYAKMCDTMRRLRELHLVGSGMGSGTQEEGSGTQE